jgi:hypothetical protein
MLLLLKTFMLLAPVSTGLGIDIINERAGDGGEPTETEDVEQELETNSAAAAA